MRASYTRSVADPEDLAARVEALERENTELRAKLAERDRPSKPQLELITQDDRRRSRVARIMLAGGVIAVLGGIFGASWFAVICGIGWIFGGAAVASTVPQSRGD
jgi:fatty acid desaturase